MNAGLVLVNCSRRSYNGRICCHFNRSTMKVNQHPSRLWYYAPSETAKSLGHLQSIRSLRFTIIVLDAKRLSYIIPVHHIPSITSPTLGWFPYPFILIDSLSYTPPPQLNSLTLINDALPHYPLPLRPLRPYFYLHNYRPQLSHDSRPHPVHRHHRHRTRPLPPRRRHFVSARCLPLLLQRRRGHGAGLAGTCHHCLDSAVCDWSFGVGVEDFEGGLEVPAKGKKMRWLGLEVGAGGGDGKTGVECRLTWYCG